MKLFFLSKLKNIRAKRCWQEEKDPPFCLPDSPKERRIIERIIAMLRDMEAAEPYGKSEKIISDYAIKDTLRHVQMVWSAPSKPQTALPELHEKVDYFVDALDHGLKKGIEMEAFLASRALMRTVELTRIDCPALDQKVKDHILEYVIAFRDLIETARTLEYKGITAKHLFAQSQSRAIELHKRIVERNALSETDEGRNIVLSAIRKADNPLAMNEAERNFFENVRMIESLEAERRKECVDWSILCQRIESCEKEVVNKYMILMDQYGFLIRALIKNFQFFLISPMENGEKMFFCKIEKEEDADAYADTVIHCAEQFALNNMDWFIRSCDAKEAMQRQFLIDHESVLFEMAKELMEREKDIDKIKH